MKEQEITANSQVFTIVVTERKPLFAMRFEQYEPNGNIKELRWKITSRAPKYYQYSYDPLNRLTSANYGFLELPANATPGQGPQAVASEEFSVPGIGYDAVGNIKSITRKGEVGAVAGASIGVWFAGGGAVPGAIIGAIVGSIVGSNAGAAVGGAVHDAIVDDKKNGN
ncbi:MAG: hypothetical protein H6566_28140 [Lewinellaceae bacterium]|nr:hypothetical protein [Lewinellaceae bacterium]